jgi:hypothetical protein
VQSGAPTGAFADQFEWLDELVEWVEASDDYQLVIRIHPRVGVTPRDDVRSPDYDLYRAKYGRQYRHCRIVWPEEKISSYDLAELADCALVSWSSMGLELARFGLPVLSGHTSVLTIAPPGEAFIALASDRRAYFAKLRQLCGPFEPGRVQALRLAYRWYNMFYLGNSIDVSDLPVTANQLPPYATPANTSIIKRVMIDGDEAMSANLETLLAMRDAGAQDRETAALRGQVARLVGFLATGRDGGASARLTVHIDGPESTAPAGNVLLVRGREIWLDDAGTTIHRYSPLMARLGRLHAALAPAGALD